MANDLKSMSRKQLEKHLRDVKAALQKLQAREKREAKKAAEKAAAQFGFSLSELTDGVSAAAKPKKTGPKKAKVQSPPKFANPNDPAQTWTGKGRQPNWYRAAIENGTAPDTMAI